MTIDELPTAAQRTLLEFYEEPMIVALNGTTTSVQLGHEIVFIDLMRDARVSNGGEQKGRWADRPKHPWLKAVKLKGKPVVALTNEGKRRLALLKDLEVTSPIAWSQGGK